MPIAHATAKTLSILDQPTDKEQAEVLSEASTFWGSEPVCTTVRTGVGVTKRAYFLDTCAFPNEQSNTLYDEVPANISYIFIENKLVQIAIDFDKLHNASKFKRCAKKDSKTLAKRQTNKNDSANWDIAVDDNSRLTYSHTAMVEKIHYLTTDPG